MGASPYSVHPPEDVSDFTHNGGGETFVIGRFPPYREGIGVRGHHQSTGRRERILKSADDCFCAALHKAEAGEGAVHGEDIALV
jgi:hypothetical protein